MWNSYTNQAHPTCFEGTQTIVLTDIYLWYESPESQIY